MLIHNTSSVRFSTVRIAMLAFLAVATLGAAGTPAGAAEPSPRASRFAWPTTAPILQGFVAPVSLYGPGHRGVSFAVTAGSSVVAIGEGTVSFAGVVAGHRYVTIAHRSGLRSTLSYLADLLVVQGDWVAQGQIIGHSTDALLLTIRRGSTYLDPSRLIGAVHARLITRTR